MLLLYVVGLTQVAKAEGGGIAVRAGRCWPCSRRPLLGQGAADARVALLLAAFAAWARLRALARALARRIGAGVVRLIAGIAVYDALVVAAPAAVPPRWRSASPPSLPTIALQTKIAGT